MNYATIKYFDIANGPGVGVSLFVSGCPVHCPGCFNKEVWDFNYGYPYTSKTTDEIVKFFIDNPQVRTFSLLGGEPMAQDLSSIAQLGHLVQELKEKTNCQHFWIWSGQKYEYLIHQPSKCLLGLFDVLVDGPFIEELKDARLAFRGSSNQRVIDLNKSRKENQVVLWEVPQ